MPHHGLHYADFLVSLASFVIIFRFFEMKSNTLIKSKKKTVVKPRANHMQNLKPTKCVCICVCVSVSPGPRSCKSLGGMRMIQFISVQFGAQYLFIYNRQSTYAVCPLRTCCWATPPRLFTRLRICFLGEPAHIVDKISLRQFH